MHHSRIFFYALFAAFALCALSCAGAIPATAAELSPATIRLDRHTVSTNPGAILVTVTPATTTIEDAFQVTFGSGWSIQNSAAAFTTSTSNLPSGVTALPGMITASAVSGQTVTFPSGDLDVGTNYGFYITGGIPTNPTTAGSHAAYQIVLNTKSGGSAIDTTIVDVPIVSNDQIVISAQILPPLSDFSALLTTESDITDIPQDTTIEYLITYGSSYHSSQPVTIVAQWSLGTIAGAGSPSVELLDYVAGSATTAYNGTIPVVDISSRTITWTIAAFPGNTANQTVSFSLKTSGEYTGSLTVTGTTAARITNPVSTTNSTSDISYSYYRAPTSGSGGGGTTTSSGGSSSSDTSTSSPAAPQPTTIPLSFTGYTQRTLTDTLAEYLVSLSKPGTLSVSYGISPTALTSTLDFQGAHFQHLATLPGLSPGTTYYLQFITKSSAGETVYSDILTTTTTSQSESFDLTSVTLFNQGIHLYTHAAGQQPTLLIPIDTPLEYTLSFTSQKAGSTLSLRFESIDKSMIFGNILYESQPGFWTGKLQTPNTVGLYTLSVEWKSALGSIQTLPMSTLIISNPITVLDAQRLKPLERARVHLWSFNDSTQLYTKLQPPNSSDSYFFTNAQGFISPVLNLGKYKMMIEALGHHSQTIVFDTRELEALPQIHLQPEAFPYINSVYYHIETAIIRLQTIFTTLQEEAQSSATIRLLTLLSIMITTPLTLLGILAQSHFSLQTLIKSFHSRTHFITNKAKSQFFKLGRVVNEQNRAVANAVITVVDPAGDTLAVLQTHKSGAFALPQKYVQPDIIVTVYAPGFSAHSLTLDDTTEQLNIQLSQKSASGTALQLFKRTFAHVLTEALEINLVASLILSIIFTIFFNSTEALPFLVLSGLNTLLYVHSQLSALLHAATVK